MSIEDPTRWYAYWWAAGAVVLIGVFAIVHTRGLARRSQVGIGLVTLSTLWFLFKEGFVRHDNHDLVFFVAVPLVLVAFAPRWRSRVWLVIAVLGLTIVAARIGDSYPTSVLRPVQSTRNFFGEAQTLVSTHKQAAVIAASRRALQEPAPLPADMVKLMQGNTVAVSPWQVSVIWARPGIRFDPLPVLQDYSAFTSSLDQLDSTFLASSRAPRYILRQPLAVIDGRITDMNHATELITGVSREWLMGTDFSTYFTESGKAREGYRQTFKEGFVRDYPLFIRHSSGRVTPVLYNAAAQTLRAGRCDSPVR